MSLKKIFVAANQIENFGDFDEIIVSFSVPKSPDLGNVSCGFIDQPFCRTVFDRLAMSPGRSLVVGLGDVLDVFLMKYMSFLGVDSMKKTFHLPPIDLRAMILMKEMYPDWNWREIAKETGKPLDHPIAMVKALYQDFSSMSAEKPVEEKRGGEKRKKGGKSAAIGFALEAGLRDYLNQLAINYAMDVTGRWKSESEFFLDKTRFSGKQRERYYGFFMSRLKEVREEGRGNVSE